MADLSYTQSAQPVSVVDEASGNTASVDATGALKVAATLGAGGEMQITDARKGAGLGNFAHVSPDHYMYTQDYGNRLMSDTFADNAFDTTNRWSSSIAGSATVTVTESILTLNTTLTAGDSTTVYFRQPIIGTAGSLIRILFSVNFGTTWVVGACKEFGYRDAAYQNGIEFRLSGSTLSFRTKRSGAYTTTDITAYLPSDNLLHLVTIEISGTGRYFVYIDDTLIAQADTPYATVIGNEVFIPFFEAYNTAALAGTPSPLKIDFVGVFDLSGDGVRLFGTDDNDIIRTVAVNSSRRLLVSQEPASAPPSTTAVLQTAYSSISANTDTTYVIPTGKTLLIQRFSSGAEGTTTGSYAELWYDPAGTGVGMSIISVIFNNASSSQNDLNDSFIGDGTKAIRMRRIPSGGGTRYVLGRWSGYYS